jgi:C1A family cysteine protease
MKKFFAILLIAGMGSFVMNSCQKSSDVKLSNDQQVSAQYSLGCNLLPAEEYAKIPVVKDPVGFPSKAALTLACPPVGNQGAEGSCVAFSPEYVYNQIKASSSCASGSYVSSGLSLLYNQGACRWSLMPYTDVSCSTMPNTTQKTDAKKYWINSYGAVTRSQSAIKAQLNAGFPVIVAGSVNNAFMNLASGAVLSTFSGSSLGGHCYCVVGYDDTKGAFKFMNSWGTGWASAGFGWVKYGYETTWWSEAYVMGN